MRNWHKILIILIIGICIATLWGLCFQHKTTTQKPAVISKTLNYFAYKGENGKSALEILKTKAKIQQNPTGLITSINNQLAEDSKRQYWGFYVNGKLANVGPAAYITKNGDLIEWKIEKY